MPLEFITLVKGFHPPTTEDRGFLINLTRARWNNSATTEAMNLFREFAETYFEMKCPESKDNTEDPENGSDSQTKEDNSNSSNKSKGPRKSYRIQFAVRELINNDVYCFLACNLADPEDFANYIFHKLAEDNDFPRPKLPLRIIPVQRICEATPKDIEQALLALLEQTIGDTYPHRFSFIDRSISGGKSISHKEIINLARNCVWATNPNCVQCIKYQDYAIVMDIIEPLFYMGVVRDFQRLASFNTWTIQRGIDNKDSRPDSEDDISDDPTLTEEAEKRRKLRIKRKRRAEQMNPSQQGNAAKKTLQEEGEEGKDDGEDGDGDGDNDLAPEENVLHDDEDEEEK